MESVKESIDIPKIEAIENRKILVYYDRPLMFFGKTKDGIKYMAVLTADDESGANEDKGIACKKNDNDNNNDNNNARFEEWAYVEISETRLSEVLTGKLDVRAVFQFPENGKMYRAKHVYSETIEDRKITYSSVSTYTYLLLDEITDDLLPEENCIISC